MPVVCPTITAYSVEDYKSQMDRIHSFAHRVQIDLTDGQFTKEKTVTPEQAWWYAGVRADFHLMYREPKSAVEQIVEHKPNLIIIHAESEGNFEELADFCHRQSVKVGVALLQNTSAETITPALHLIDHVLIFSGNLGYQGGSRAELGLLQKVNFLRSHKPQLEIGWDGGVDDQNISKLIIGGVDVINVGGFIQKADEPAKTYSKLQRIAEDTKVV
jgi:ribulose-phosphate 3-epimerase